MGTNNSTGIDNIDGVSGEGGPKRVDKGCQEEGIYDPKGRPL